MKTLEEAAPYFRYADQPPKNTRLILLTRQGQVEVGPWKGPDLGQNGTYIAWSGVPPRDPVAEATVKLLLDQQ